jgi:hypothetical protein
MDNFSSLCFKQICSMLHFNNHYDTSGATQDFLQDKTVAQKHHPLPLLWKHLILQLKGMTDICGKMIHLSNTTSGTFISIYNMEQPKR